MRDRIYFRSGWSVALLQCKKLLLRMLLKQSKRAVPLNSRVGEYLILGEPWAPEIASAIRFLKPNGSHTNVFIDVGANIGAISEQIKDSFDKFILIDPLSRVLSLARYNLGSDSRVAYISAAITPHDHIQIDLSDIGSSKPVDASDVGHAKERVEPIEVLSMAVLAETMEALGCDNHTGGVIKIDVEGDEAYVIKQLAEVLDLRKFSVICEINSSADLEQIKLLAPDHFKLKLGYPAREGLWKMMLSLFKGQRVYLEDCDVAEAQMPFELCLCSPRR